ncbi:stAR-related lipid transfer protein 6 isoform X1 [Pipistrellus kuhlii]|uniref:stAR-related lipid transfer protein 6 isoform X1 n=1 Tax=Pipistrellus kuhlii TaxID=59472 RepID=UPI001E2713FE|nr:stAR-related lipid transfer protein 6 isoform X1 [Pipistrellus kuhlii]
MRDRIGGRRARVQHTPGGPGFPGRTAVTPYGPGTQAGSPGRGRLCCTDRCKDPRNNVCELPSRPAQEMRCEEPSFNQVAYPRRCHRSVGLCFFPTDPAGEETLITPPEQTALSPCHTARYRVEGIISESTSKLADFLFKPEIRITWDKSLKEYTLIHKIDSDTFICHAVTQSFAMGSISSRDFINMVYFKRCDGNVYVISSISVDFPGFPPSSHYIRGYNHASGFVCSPLNDNPAQSKLVMFVQTEMKGKLSPSIIEATMPSNLVALILNAKDGIKTYKGPPDRGYNRNSQSLHKKK